MFCGIFKKKEGTSVMMTRPKFQKNSTSQGWNLKGSFRFIIFITCHILVKFHFNDVIKYGQISAVHTRTNCAIYFEKAWKSQMSEK